MDNYSQKTLEIRELNEMIKDAAMSTLESDEVIIQEDKALEIYNWLLNHEQLKNNFPYDILKDEFEKVVVDGHIEDKHLKRMFQIFCFIYDPIHNISPYVNKNYFSFANLRVCVTGQFEYGSREDILKLLDSSGAKLQDRVTRNTDMLVVGEYVSKDWAQSNYGSKIKQAIEYQQKGMDIPIVREREFLKLLKTQGAEQLTLEETGEAEPEETKQTTNGIKIIDEFLEAGTLGCCDLYNDCSESGHCLQTDSYYNSCTYRKNLENGQIFYGKKSQYFNQEHYDYIDKFRCSLDTDKQSLFDEILLYFEKIMRGANRCLCIFSQDIFDIINGCDVFEISTDNELVRTIFEKGLISRTKAAELHSLYSKLPAPELLPLPPKLSKSDSANSVKKEEREKMLEEIGAKNLKIWENHFLANKDLQKVISSLFITFKIKSNENGKSEYRSEMEEFYLDRRAIFYPVSERFPFFNGNNFSIFAKHIESLTPMICLMHVSSQNDLKISMYRMFENNNTVPQIHVKYSGSKATFDFDGNILEGKLPVQKQQMVQSWIKIHKDDLTNDWELLQNGKSVFEIPPLETLETVEQ